MNKSLLALLPWVLLACGGADDSSAKGTSGAAGVVSSPGGSGGSSGSSGNSGTAGTGGTAGTAGTAGTGGTAGMAGAGGEAGTAGTSGAAGSAGSGASGAGGTTVAPTLHFDFVSADSPAFHEQEIYGSVAFGAADESADDQKVVTLGWQKDTEAIGPGGKATEIGTLAEVGFGHYRFRAKLATCKPDEELVNGFFIYRNDGADHGGDGLVDNTEIDIEILCSQPTFLNLTSWTGYTDDDHMKKISRTIDLETGTIYVGIPDQYGYDGNDPQNGSVDTGLIHPGWYDPTQYYEMGWDWHADHIRWFIVLGGDEITLWTLTDTTRIPQSKANMLFNLWHPGAHWNKDGEAMPATEDATLSVDWFSYTTE